MNQKIHNRLIEDIFEHFKNKNERDNQEVKKRRFDKLNNYDLEENIKKTERLLNKIGQQNVPDLSEYLKESQNNFGRPQKNIFYVDSKDFFDKNNFKNKYSNLNKESVEKTDGHKESNNKQEFELDWEFIESMAKRMAKNKVKYGKDNWKKPMEVEQLKQALFRHSLEIMKGNYHDEDKLDHLDAIALNAMFIKYQIKHYGLHSK